MSIGAQNNMFDILLSIDCSMRQMKENTLISNVNNMKTRETLTDLFTSVCSSATCMSATAQGEHVKFFLPVT